MSDDFEKAVLFAFDQTGGVSPQVQAQAQAILQSALASPDAWQLCISRLESTGYVEVKFWCLQTLHAIISSPSYVALAQPFRDQIKRALLLAGGGAKAVQLPPFLRNKIAQALVAIAGQEFPERWPGFFQDVLSTLSQGRDAVDLFCRILVAIDEDIISLDVPRSASEAKRSMHFKDAMRESSLTDIAMSWCQLVAATQDSDPDIAASILDAVRRYVHWIDISLVANDTFVPVLFSVLNASAAEPRRAAAGVLTEVVSKRMEAEPKLELIQKLGVVPVCAAWATSGLPGIDEEHDLAVAYSKLLAALATEVLEAWKKVENSLVSLAAVGLDVGEEAGAEAASMCGAASRMLDALFPAVLAALRVGDDEIAASLAPFLLSYVARVRMLQKLNNGIVPLEAAQQLPAILEAVATCARFPSDSAAYEIAAATTVAKVASQEEEASMTDRRHELFTVFRNAAKLAPTEAYTAVGRRLEDALGRTDAPWQDIELPLSLLFVLGESAPDAALRPDGGPLATLASAVLRADIPAARHRLVALALLETCARYTRVLQQQATELLPRAVSLFLGPSGLGHPATSVPPRAAYLFCRLCKVLRGQMHPLARDILRSLQPHLAAIAASPLPEATTPSKAAGATSTRNPLGTGVSAADDRLYAFEAAGLLIGSEDVGEKEQLEWLWGLLGPLMAQLEGRSGDSPALLQQALDALTRASKGFTPKTCVQNRPEVGRVLVGPLVPATSALRRLPGHKPYRAKFMAYVHRLVECLGSSILDKISTVVWALQQPRGDAADLADVIGLLNQVISKFPDVVETLGLVRASFPEMVADVHVHLHDDWDWSGIKAWPAMASSPANAARFAGAPAAAGSTEDLRERGELQKLYYVYLLGIASAGLARSLLGAPRDSLNTALNDLIQGAGTHVDAAARKTCIQALGKLATDWLDVGGGSTMPADQAGGGRSDSSPSPPVTVAAGEEALPGLKDFFLRRFGCDVLLEGLAGPESLVDVRDAAAISLLTEVSVQLKAMYRLGGQEYLSYLCGTTLPKVGWPAAAGEQLALHITQSGPKELKTYLKAAMLELRGLSATRSNGSGM